MYVSGNYFIKKDNTKAVVDYGFIDAPPPQQQQQTVLPPPPIIASKPRMSGIVNNGVQTKESTSTGNHNNNANHSRTGNEVFFRLTNNLPFISYHLHRKNSANFTVKVKKTEFYMNNVIFL